MHISKVQIQKIKKRLNLTRQTAVFASIVMAFGSIVSVPIARADNFQEQINQLNSANSGLKQQTQTLAVEADSLQSTIDNLTTQINGLQAQINDNTAKSDALQLQIVAAQTELEKQKSLLGDSIKAMYLEGDISTIEMLATSNNLSDFFDKQQYRDVVKSKIKATLDKVTTLKAQLKDQQDQLKDLIQQQTELQTQIAAQNAEQQRLLSLNQDQQSNLNAQIQSNFSQISNLRRQQAAAIAALSGGNGTSAVGSPIQYKNLTGGSQCGGGYAYCNYALDQFVFDPWGLYMARECVHYVAWALADRGIIQNRQYFNGNGNANQWAGVLGAQGVAYTDNNPDGAAMAYLPIAPLGHVVMIEQNYGNGWLHVSQYNWQPGMYSTMDLKVTSNLLFFHFR